MVLADTAFGSADFIGGVRSLKYHAVTGLLSSRRLVDGRHLKRLHKRGQQVHLKGFNKPVWVSWFGSVLDLVFSSQSNKPNS